MIAEPCSRRLLLVESDRSFFRKFGRVTRRSACATHVDLASSSSEALHLMHKQHYEAVIADMQIPGLDGAEFLAATSHLYPRTMRFALSDATGRTSVLRAAGLAHQFFSRPCSPETLVEAVNRIARFRELLSDESAEEMIAAVESLPLLPRTYRALSKLLGRKKTTISELEYVAAADVALAAKVFHLANWGVFSPRHPVLDLRQALCCLTVDGLRRLFLSARLFREFDPAAVEAFNIETQYRRAARIAELARIAAQQLDPDPIVTQAAGTAGLLHDVGCLVYITARPHEYLAACREHTQDGYPIQDLERKLFGMSHAETGAALMLLWGMSPQITEAIIRHHDDTCFAPASPVVSAVRLAEAIADHLHTEVQPAEESAGENPV